jgi:hypothetical protein
VIVVGALLVVYILARSSRPPELKPSIHARSPSMGNWDEVQERAAGRDRVRNCKAWRWK